MSSFTAEQLQKLEEAIAQGVLTVEYSDKRITYRSMDELMRARDLIKKELGLTSNTGQRLYMSHTKGVQ